MEILYSENEGPLTCHECGEIADRLIRVGGDPDWEPSAACICSSCVTNAFELIHA